MEQMQSESIIEITKALIKASKNFKQVGKESQGQAGNRMFKYAGLESIINSVEQPLLENGIFVRFYLKDCQEEASITLMLTHESGEWLSSCISTTKEGKNVKDIGAWITYMRRYHLLAMLNLCPTEDLDGEALDKYNTTTGGTKKLKTKQDLQAELIQIKEDLANLPELEAKVVGHYGSIEKAPPKDYNILRERIAKAKGVQACAS